MKLRAGAFIFPRVMKILGVLMILFALTGLWVIYIRKGVFEFTTPSQIIGPGLMMIFFSREKIDDERIHHFKFNSLVAGFVAVYLFTMGWHSLTSHEFVVLVLTFALAIFYILKFKL